MKKFVKSAKLSVTNKVLNNSRLLTHTRNREPSKRKGKGMVLDIAPLNDAQ